MPTLLPSWASRSIPSKCIFAWPTVTYAACCKHGCSFFKKKIIQHTPFFITSLSSIRTMQPEPLHIDWEKLISILERPLEERAALVAALTPEEHALFERLLHWKNDPLLSGA